MRIGIDIDNTVSNTNELIIEEFLKYDYNNLGNRGFKDREAYYFTKMFNITEEEFLEFVDKYYHRIIPQIPAKSHAAEVINRLRKEGNEIYFITNRNNYEFKNPYQITKKWLKRNGFTYDKLLVDVADKGEAAVKYNIDLFIDDLPKNLASVSNKNIDVLMMDVYYNRNINEYKRVISWEEVYNIIKSR